MDYISYPSFFGHNDLYWIYYKYSNYNSIWELFEFSIQAIFYPI